MPIDYISKMMYNNKKYKMNRVVHIIKRMR